MDQKNFNVIQINVIVKLMFKEIIVTCVDLVIGIWKHLIQMDVQVKFLFKYNSKFKKKLLILMKSFIFFFLKECDVEVNGTIYNKGCDQNSGKLYPCKKNVEGKRCDRCKPGFYSLSDNQNGCSACNCSLGFSYSDPCDPITGQCKCKPSFKGRKCDQIEEGYFCPSIDYLIYEAEESIFINNLTHINKKQNLNEKSMEWTGLGYVRCFEGAIIKFKFKHNHNAAIFDVYLRYALKPSLDQVQIRINNYGSNGEHQAFHRCHDLIPNQNKIEQKISHINICNYF